MTNHSILSMSIPLYPVYILSMSLSLYPVHVYTTVSCVYPVHVSITLSCVYPVQVFKQLIEYLHTGSCHLQARTLLGLINAADHFSVDELKQVITMIVLYLYYSCGHGNPVARLAAMQPWIRIKRYTHAFMRCSALVAWDQHVHCTQRSVRAEGAGPGQSTGFPCPRQ